MGFRVPAPDGRKERDGRPVLVLPEATVLNETYETRYLTVGGMSVAYKGLSKGNTYFIKEVDAQDTRRVLSLSREKSLIERLKHPGIVKYHDFFQYDGFCYLVLEYIEGPSLDKLISPIPDVFLQEKVVSEWAHQLYDIFQYLHRQNPRIIYRDLKPSNVIKDTQGRIRLVDFGIARIYKEDRGHDTEPMGSAITASPEHYGGKQTDVRSDIYTLGATLNYLLTNGRGRQADIFSYAPVREINPRVSENLERVISKALLLEPAIPISGADATRSLLWRHR
jgi:serine/threonine protein kinase